MNWGTVNARARGLATHLLRRATLDRLARVPDLVALAAELARVGYLAPDAGATAGELDLAVRRRTAGALRALARWAADHPELLEVVYGDEERRSLRALLRGALDGAPADARVAGLIPTPDLPERALTELARQPTPGAVVALLIAWRHPYGPALGAEAEARQPDALRLEVCLGRAFASRALAAGRAGGRGLLGHVRESIDLENALAAVVLADQPGDVTPKDVFLPGGARVTITVFEQAVASGRATAAADVISRVLPGSSGSLVAGATAVARALVRHGAEPAQLERTLLHVRIANLHDRLRVDPLGPALVLEFALRLRAQAMDLRRIVWGVALAAPATTVVAALVTA